MNRIALAVSLLVLAPRAALALPNLTPTDLRVDTLSVAPGGRITVDWTVRNLGDADVDVSPYWVVLSVNDVITPRDAVIVTGFLRVDALSDLPVSEEFFVPPTMRPGVYRLGVIIDPEGQLAQTDAFDDTAVLAEPVLVGTDQVTVTSGTLPDAARAAPYCQALVAAGGDGTYDWTARSALPPGLSLTTEPAAGGDGFDTLVCGVPTLAGSFSFDVQVTSGAAMATKRINLRVTEWTPRLALIPSPLAAATGVPFEADLHAAGGAPPYTWSLDGTAPAGLALSGSGVVSGTVASPGDLTLRVVVQDSTGATASGSLDLVVRDGPAAITCPADPRLPPATAGAAYTAQPSAAGGTWTTAGTRRLATSVDDGEDLGASPPPGLSLASSGAISGTPTFPGTYVWTAAVADAQRTVRCPLVLEVAGPSALRVTSGALPGACAGEAYEARLEATGGTGPVTWTLGPDPVLPGATLSADGVLTAAFTAEDLQGNPSRALHGSAIARDSTGLTAVAAIGLVLRDCSAPKTGESDGEGGCSTSGGGATLLALGLVLLALRRRALLPALLILPAVASAAPDLTPVLLEAEPVAAAQDSLVVSRHVANLGDAPARTALRYVLSVDASVSPDDRELPRMAGAADPDVPTGGTVESFERLLVPPDVPPGVYRVGLVVDPANAVAEADESNNELVTAATVEVREGALRVGTTQLTPAVNGASYLRQLVAVGGAGAYLWTLAGGSAAPPGLRLQSDGVVAGTPAQTGLFSFTVRVQSGGSFAQADLELAVADPVGAAGIVTASLPDAIAGSPYDATLEGTGGAPPYTWTATGLPPGLALAGGAIQGTPGATGCAAVSLGLGDALGNTDARDVELCVLAGDRVALQTQALQDAMLGEPYRQVITAAGGARPMTFTVTGLDGAALSAAPEGEGAVALSGTPEAAGVFPVKVAVADATGLSDERLFVLVIRGRVLVLGPANLPGASRGVTYPGAQLTANGSGVTFALAGGALPPGLTLDASGAISGAVAGEVEPGVFPFLVRATDEAGGEGYESFAIEVIGEGGPLTPGEASSKGCCGGGTAADAMAPALALVWLRRRRRIGENP